MQSLALSTSFVQDQRHASKSPRFVPVQPLQLAAVLADHGFELGHLETSRARNPERADYQTTVARYVSRDSADIIEALGSGTLDILVRAPHLTGAIELRLGFFRGTCANQWNFGKLLATFRTAHTGNCLEALNHAIPQLVAQRGQLVESIHAMSMREVSTHELVSLAKHVASLRMAGVENASNVQVTDLLQPRRASDRNSDLFTVANVLQENALRYGMRYELPAETNDGVRHMTTRKVVETSGAAIDLTGNIWEAAAALLAA